MEGITARTSTHAHLLLKEWCHTVRGAAAISQVDNNKHNPIKASHWCNFATSAALRSNMVQCRIAPHMRKYRVLWTWWHITASWCSPATDLGLHSHHIWRGHIYIFIVSNIYHISLYYHSPYQTLHWFPHCALIFSARGRKNIPPKSSNLNPALLKYNKLNSTFS